MSWIFGAVGKGIDDRFTGSLDGLLNGSHLLLKSPELVLYSGGIKETCHLNVVSESPAEGWLVSGIGIDYCRHDFRLMSKDDWSSLFSKSMDDRIKQLDGHFVTIQWSKNEISFHTDQLGLRQLFFTEIGHGQFAFSTRLDWISRSNTNSTIDFREFGSQWLLHNRLSLNSIATETMRISQGGEAKYVNGKLSTSNKPWSPSMGTDLPDEDHISILEKLTRLPLKDGASLSLALSGGLDSRVLLSILLSSEYKDWSLHSLHHPENPDIKIAKLISSELGIEHQFIEDEIPDAPKCIALLDDYVGYTHAVSPASNFIGLQFYSQLYQQSKIVIDGGLGEIARHRYLNRLLRLGKKYLLDGDYGAILPYIKQNRAPIFSAEVNNRMNEGVTSEIMNLADSMPDIREIGIDNWTDLLAIRTRLPNLAGLEQSRADTEVVTYMPFAQPSFLRHVFSAAVSERRNGTFFKKMLRKNRVLSSFPLAKDGVVYPLFFPNTASSIYIGLRRKYGKMFHDNLTDLFLGRVSEYVQDTLTSSSVKNCGYYNYNFIAETVSAYYKGDKEHSSIVNWWLSFETFRQQISNKI
ncbi:MAG: asparagine synthase-related protein [Candidatus Latescibacterota bacterium]